jgi:ribosomal protein S18 acetylase RimI-like enzyme
MLFTSAPKPSLVGELARVIESASAACPSGSLSQTLLDPSEHGAHDAFREAGFLDVGTLDYLQRRRPTSREAQGWALESGDLGEGVRMVTAPTKSDTRLTLALERSYEGTLDCPELCGMRETVDVIASHRATGVHDPCLWWLIERGDEPLGAVLANPSPSPSAVELVYMGVAPELRGVGVGGRALRHLLATCATRSEHLVTCAVDRRNAPARTLYEKHGFTSTQTRIALVKRVD